MPVFYPPQNRQFAPLTPPEFYDEFGPYGKAKYHQHGGYQPYDDMSQNPFMMNAGHYYMPSAAEQQARYEAEMKRQARANYQAQVQREHIYGPIAAPILPPLPGADKHAHGGSSFAGGVQAPSQKEEKSAGGVAAHLDYDMDTMVDFIAEMTSAMFKLYVNKVNLAGHQLVRVVGPSRKEVDPKFRSYVSSVLTSTRLPKATILLAMHYLSGRVTYLASKNTVHHSRSNAIYHLLTVGLMLSSKFLDDNTFQNRSWAEVSSLRVEELNTREQDWLAGMEYRLHVDWEERDGVRAWFERWDEYVHKQDRLNLEALKLSPIETDVGNYRTSRFSSPGTFSPPAPGSAFTRHSMSPPSVNPTAVNTPDFCNIRSAVSHADLRQPQQYHGPNLSWRYQMYHQQEQQQQAAMQAIAPACISPQVQGNLVYTRESSAYGPGYVLETRSNGMSTWEVHNFVGVDYTQQYAAQLQIGWCDMHRRLDCMVCLGRAPGHGLQMGGVQAVAA